VAELEVELELELELELEETGRGIARNRAVSLTVSPMASAVRVTVFPPSS